MSSFGRAHKYAGNRRQEIQLQKELQAIRNKAILEHLAKQHGGMTGRPLAESPTQSGDNVTIPHTTVPPLQMKLRSHSSRKKTQSLKEPHGRDVTHGPQLSVLTKPVTKPSAVQQRRHQGGTTHQQLSPHSKESSPQKMVYDTSQSVRFAITSTLNTSAPMKYNKRADQTTTQLPQKQHGLTKTHETSHSRHIETHYVPSSGRVISPIAESELYSDDVVITSSAGGEEVLQPSHQWSSTDNRDSLHSSTSDMSANTHTHSGSLELKEKHSHLPDRETATIPLKLNVNVHHVSSQDKLFSLLSHHDSTNFQHTPASSNDGEQSSLQSMSSLSSVLTRITVESCTTDHSQKIHSDGSNRLASGMEESIGSKSTLVSSSIGGSQEHINDLVNSDDDDGMSIQSGSTLSSHTHERAQLPTVDLSMYPGHDSPSEAQSSSLGLDKGVAPSVSILDAHSEVILEQDKQGDVVSSPTAQSAPAIINQHQEPGQSQHQLETVLESDYSDHSTLKAPSSTITDEASSDEISSVGLPPFSLPSQDQSFETPSSQHSTNSSVSFATPSYSSPPAQQSTGASLQGLMVDHKYGTASENYISTSSWLMSLQASTVPQDTIHDDDDTLKDRTDYEIDHMPSVELCSSASEREDGLDSAGASGSETVEPTADHSEIDKHFKETSSTDLKSVSVGSLSKMSAESRESTSEGNLTEKKDSMDKPEVQFEHRDEIKGGTSFTSVSEDSETQPLDENKTLPSNLPEYLAYSDKPLTLEDILHVSGKRVDRPSTAVGRSLQAHSKKPSLLHSSDTPHSILEKQSSLRFLSTWTTSQSSRPTIHHFCTTDDALLPQLPLPLQLLSRTTHTKSDNITDTSSSQDTSVADPSPPRPPQSKHIIIPSSTQKQGPAVTHDDTSYTPIRALPSGMTRGGRSTNSKRHSQESSTVHSSTFLSTPKLTAPRGNRDDDVILAAKTRLQRELKTVTSSSTPEDQNRKRGMRRQVLTSGGGMDPKQQQSRVRPATTGGRGTSGCGELTVSGDHMMIIRDPSNLLWTPAPPKLSLYPSTIQTHLFPTYHAPQSTVGVSLGRESYLLPGQQSGTTNNDITTSKLRVYNPAIHSVPNFASLKPLVITSTSNHSTSSNDNDNDSHLTVPLTNQCSDDNSKTVQEVTDGVSNTPSHSSSSSSDDVSAITEGQSIQEQQLSRVLTSSLSARRHTVYASGSGMVEMISSRGLTIQEEEEEEEEDGGTDEKETDEQVGVVLPMTRSLPLLPLATDGVNGGIKMSSEFTSVMNQVKWQRECVMEYHKQQEELLRQQHLQEMNSEEELQSDDMIPLEGSMLASSGAFTSRRLQRAAMRGTRKPGSTLGRIKAIRRSRSAQMRVQKARELLSQPPRQLVRSTSFPLLTDEENLTVRDQPSTDYRNSKRLSLPCLNKDNFLSLMTSQGAQSSSCDNDQYQWACDVWWETWFPQVLKECREAVAGMYSRGSTAIQRPTRHFQNQPSGGGDTLRHDKDEKRDDDVIPPTASEEDMKIMSLVDISPLPQLSTQQIQECEMKLVALSRDISTCKDDSMLAVCVCRRGALLRKLGRLPESMADLNEALSLLPSLSDAYWHHHLLHLVTGDTQQALSDLTSLLKLNRKHYGAYRSRAALYTRSHLQSSNQGVVGGASLSMERDVAKAIYDLSQAIAMEPVAETFFMRAELHEMRGEVESAVSDYARVTELDPSNLEALYRQAMHKFKKGMWAAATKHFDMLLKQDPNNTGARIHRAKAQYNMDCYVEALQDLSAAIHLDPSNAQAFYHRACLLRRHQPQQAIRDFSISLLLDNSKGNVSSFIHRGVLYTLMKCYEEALCDFEAALNLQRSLPSAHVCAGLIHLLHFKNLPRAVRFFSSALAVDPTFVRAYLCRAEAYNRGNNYAKAILDYTRAIHFEPDNPRYFLLKGELYLHLGENELASLHIKTASKLSSERDQSKTQRALVESFLGNHDEAISLLTSQLKTPDVCTLLGKVQMKAEMFGEAANSFRQAAALVDRARKPSYLVAQMSELDKPDKDSVTIKAQTNIHFLCGRSLVENGAWKEAIEEFTTVLELEPSHEMAYYERGVAKLKAGNSRGVLDLNKTLALNPQLHQAFLSRAAYYGRKGRFSKAILNCNEALRLEPRSVRAYLCRGALKYHTKLYNGAIDDFNTSISMDRAHSSLAHFNRALCYQAIGHLDKALSDYSIVLLLKNSPKFKVLVNRGLLYLQLKDFTNALFDFIQAGTLVQDDPNILQAIGHCYHQLGSLDSAIEAFSEAIQLEPTFVGAFVSRGNVYMDYLTAESFNNCKSDYQYSLYLDPHCLPAKINLAFLYQAEGKFQQAWNELTSALKEDRCCVAALEARAIISLQMGNLFGALLDINAAINVSKSAILLTNRGVVHQYMGDVVSAMRDYEEAVNIDHTYFLAHFNAGNVHFQQRHFTQAITSYTQALSACLSPDHSILINRAIAYVMLQHTQPALEDFNHAIDVNPYSAHALFNRANLYKSMGEYHLAQLDYKRALELDPQDWLAMYYHGEMLGKLGHKELARPTFQQAAQTETT